MTERGDRSLGSRCIALVFLILVTTTIITPSLSSALLPNRIQDHLTAKPTPNEKPDGMRIQTPQTPTVLWSYGVIGQIYYSAAVGDLFGNGKLEVIVGSTNNNAYCLNGTTGSRLWSYATGNVVFCPVVADLFGDGKKEVVVGSYDSYTYCLNGMTGSKLWSVSARAVDSSPAFADLLGNGGKEVITGSFDGSVYCLNGTTGSILWSYATGGPIYSSPAVADLFGKGKLDVVVGSNDNSVYCLNGTTGGKLWSYATGGPVYSSPAIVDLFRNGKLEIVVGSNDYSVYCLNGTTGSKLWSYQTGDHVVSSPVFADIFGNGKNEVIIGSWDGFVYCISMAPGSSYVGESSFIDIQSEFSSGDSPPTQGLWYAWVNKGSSQVVMLATSFIQGAGPSMNGHQLPSPVSVIIGEHFNTSRGEVFVANTPTFMEIYNDSNHNRVPDSDFVHHASEITYYIIWNASQSFYATPVEKQVDQESVIHYRWSVRYSGVAGILQPPFFDVQDQYPVITCWINYVECSYDYYLRGDSSYLKVGFAISPLTDLQKLGNVNGSYQMVPANLSLEGMSLAVLFSTSIACANPSYEVTVQGQPYNSTTTQTPNLPADNATINIGNGAVYNFVYNQNYSLLKDHQNQTYISKGSACGDVSVLSPYVLASGGACLFLRWAQTVKVVEDLISRISNSLQVSTILSENSSFFYRVSFPVWSNGTLSYDPTYIENPQVSPGNLGLDNATIIVVCSVAAIGVIMLLVDLFERRKKVNLVRGQHAHSFAAL
jgi:outer membrane protein assembly factor BamB